MYIKPQKHILKFFKKKIQNMSAYHNIPLVSWSNATTHLKNHPCQQPKEATYTVLSLVVSRNSNINKSHW